MPTCAADALAEWVTAVFRTTGADEDVAGEVGRHLVRANLSGHDSHGVLRVPQYIAQIDQQQLVPGARPEVAKETTASALIDAHRGFGHFSTAVALEWALGRARQQGMASAAVRHSAHTGRLGEYAERAADAGMIAVLTVGAAGQGVGWMPATGGRDRFVGANPWSMGFPGERRAMVFDGSMTNIARGKVDVARAEGAPLPPGCITDQDGGPTREPEDFYADGSLMPLGGDIAGHKGYGLGLASALLGGLAMIGDEDPALIGADIFWERPEKSRFLAGVFLLVIDPATFGDPGDYRSAVDSVLGAAKQGTPAPGIAEILVPGEFEKRNRARSETQGISLPEPTWNSLAVVAERFDLPMPRYA